MTSPISVNNPKTLIVINEESEEIKKIMEETGNEVIKKNSNEIKIALPKSEIDTYVESIAPQSKVTPAIQETTPPESLAKKTIVPYFDMLNYQAQASLFNDLDRFTEGTDRLRWPAFIAWNVSSAIGIATRILSIAEVTIHGLALLFIAPFSENSVFCMKKSYELTSMIPMKIVKAIGFFFIAIPINGFCLIVDPNWSIPSNAICAKQDLMRAKGYTIDDDYEDHPKGLTLHRQRQRSKIFFNLQRTTLHRLM